jgi:hypothetical protein
MFDDGYYSPDGVWVVLEAEAHGVSAGQQQTAVTTPIETAGSTAFTQIGDGYFLGGSGPQLKLGGAPISEGQFGGWSPIGA